MTSLMDIPFQLEREGTKWRILQIDPKSACPSTMLSNAAWFYGPEDPKKTMHSHNIGEVVAYFGSDWERPQEMNGQVTIYMEGEKHSLRKSFMMYAPPGSRHCPYTIDAVERPIYHTAYPIGRKIKSERYPNDPYDAEEKEDPQYNACFVVGYEGREKPLFAGEIPILHLDGTVAENAPTIDLSWLTAAAGEPLVAERIQDNDQLYLFMGSDWENALELGGEIELVIGGEMVSLTKPAYVFAPKGEKFGPVYVRKVDKPIMMSVCEPDPKDPHYLENI